MENLNCILTIAAYNYYLQLCRFYEPLQCTEKKFAETSKDKNVIYIIYVRKL